MKTNALSRSSSLSAILASFVTPIVWRRVSDAAALALYVSIFFVIL